jgi:hypothetical protein
VATEFEEEFFKDSYESEIERMHKLDSAVTLPAAIVTVLGGWVVFYAQNFPSSSWNVFFILFVVFLVAASVLWIGSIYYLIQSYFGYKYELIANPDDVAIFLTGLRNHFGAIDPPQENIDETVDNELRDFLVEQYQAAATTNRAANMQRIRWGYRSNRCLVGMLIALGLSVLPFWVAFERKPQKMEIVNNPVPVKIESSPHEAVLRIEVDGKLQLVQPKQP